MRDRRDLDRYFSGACYRFFFGLFGLFLIALGIYVMCFGVVGLALRIGAGAIITLLGANAVWASLHARQSWLARLGVFM